VVYVALGDSMSIDKYAGGPGRGAAALFFRNHPDWPEFEGRDLTTVLPDLEFRPLAFDGATSEGVLALQVPELARLSNPPTIITLTAGGNDLLSFFGLPESQADAAARHLRTRLERILEACVEVVGDSGCVILGNIYDPSDGQGHLPGNGFPLWKDSMSVLALFNRTIAEVSRDFPVYLVDTHAHFLGHGLQAGDPGLGWGRANDESVWYTGLVEPNARGAHELRRLFWQAFLECPLGRAACAAAKEL